MPRAAPSTRLQQQAFREAGSGANGRDLADPEGRPLRGADRAREANVEPPRWMAPNPAFTFLFKVDGHSMIEARIFRGGRFLHRTRTPIIHESDRHGMAAVHGRSVETQAGPSN